MATDEEWERANRVIHQVIEERKIAPTLDRLLTKHAGTIAGFSQLQIALDYGVDRAIGVGNRNLIRAIADLIHDTLGGGEVRAKAMGGASKREADERFEAIMKRLGIPFATRQAEPSTKTEADHA